MAYPYPPRISDDDEFMLDNEFSVASGTEMTGLMPTPAQDRYEADSYADIYDVPVRANNKADAHASERSKKRK